MSFSLTSLIPGVGAENAHVATAAIVSAGLVAVGVVANRAVTKDPEAGVVPDGRVSLKGLCELLTEFVANSADMVMGHDGKQLVPFFCAIFTFVFINNLVGVIPGMTPATENMNTTFVMGIFIFLMYNYMGVRANGWGYLKHFFGPVIFLAPLMVIIEIVSHLVRPLSLGLRLANVMMGDHTAVGVFTDLVPFLVPIPLYLLGIFVCFVQAFVFMLLSMVYISLATAHDH